MRTSPLKQDVTGFVVLLAFFALAAFALFSSSTTFNHGKQTVSLEYFKDPSVNNDRGSGSKGLFDWTRKLGYKPQVWRHDFNKLPNDADVLICIAPNAPPIDLSATAPASRSTEDTPSDDQPKQNLLTGAEGTAVEKWLSKGHTLILAASSLPTLSQTEALSSAKDKSSGDDDQTTFASELGIDMQSALKDDTKRDFAPLQPGKWTNGVVSIRIHGGSRLKRDFDDGVVLMGDYAHIPGSPAIPAKPAVTYKVAHPKMPGGPKTVTVAAIPARPGKPASLLPQPVVMIVSVGSGRLIAISDDFFFCNNNLCRSNNATLTYNLIANSAKPGATILFDEYHRDYGGQAASFWDALGRPVQFASLQLALFLIVALLVLSPRLGRVTPLEGADVRTSAEYVTSLAGLYQNAEATKTALETVYRQFLREFCQRFGVPPSVTLDTLADIAARRGRVNGADMRKVLIACERALESKQLSERDLIALVRALERFRKELGIG